MIRSSRKIGAVNIKHICLLDLYYRLFHLIPIFFHLYHIFSCFVRVCEPLPFDRIVQQYDRDDQPRCIPKCTMYGGKKGETIAIPCNNTTRTLNGRACIHRNSSNIGITASNNANNVKYTFCNENKHKINYFVNYFYYFASMVHELSVNTQRVCVCVCAVCLLVRRNRLTCVDARTGRSIECQHARLCDIGPVVSASVSV